MYIGILCQGLPIPAHHPGLPGREQRVQGQDGLNHCGEDPELARLRNRHISSVARGWSAGEPRGGLFTLYAARMLHTGKTRTPSPRSVMLQHLPSQLIGLGSTSAHTLADERGVRWHNPGFGQFYTIWDLQVLNTNQNFSIFNDPIW